LGAREQGEGGQREGDAAEAHGALDAL
jgi:hypothetical protein